MKKRLIFLMLVLLSFSIFINSKTSIKLVFNEMEDKNINLDNSYDYFYVKDKENNLNSSNLLKILSMDDIKIIGIYPNLKKINDSKVKEKLQYYNFSLINSNSINLNKFINNYVSILKNNNYIEQANLVYFDGIQIDKVLVYTSYNSISLLKKQNKNLIYQNREI